MRISGRLRRIADLVTDGYTVADIGTDHGYVPITLLKENKVPHAIAVDLSRDALIKAVKNACRAHVITPEEETLFTGSLADLVCGQETSAAESKLDFRLSDGLSALAPGEAQCIVISGMGGILMCSILEARKEVSLSAKELILSPHRDVDLVRGFLLEHGFRLVHDEKLTDKKKEYTILKGVACIS